MLQAYLYPLLLATLTTGFVGLLCPDGENKGAIRILCGAVLAIALLMPLTQLQETVDRIVPEIGNDTVQDPSHSDEKSVVAIKQAALEQALVWYLGETWGIQDANLSLSVNADDPAAVQILGAVIRGQVNVSEEYKRMVCEDLEEMLECRVYWEVVSCAE